MTRITCSLVAALCLASSAASATEPAAAAKGAKPAAVAQEAVAKVAGSASSAACSKAGTKPASAAAIGTALCEQIGNQVGGKPTDPNTQALGNQARAQLGQALAKQVVVDPAKSKTSTAPAGSAGALAQQAKEQATQAVGNQLSSALTTGSAKPDMAGIGKQLKGQAAGVVGTTAAASISSAVGSGSATGSMGEQVKGQAAQILGSQVSARLTGNSKGQGMPELGKQVQGQAAQVAGSMAATQMSKIMPGGPAAAAGQEPGVAGQMGSQVSKTLGTTLTQMLSGDRKTIDPKAELQNGLGTSAANALAAPVALKLGSSVPVSESTLAAGLQKGLTQGLNQGISSELQKRAGLAAGQTAPGLQASVQDSTKSALTTAALEQMTSSIPAGQKPLAGDLLQLGLKRSGVVIPGAVGSFVPPSNSALPMSTEGLRTGVSILSNNNGQAGLGVKSSVDVGSQKVEISGALDPNSNAEQGKSAGVQIKIGGN